VASVSNVVDHHEVVDVTRRSRRPRVLTVVAHSETSTTTSPGKVAELVFAALGD
jgi:hypothetical protein